MKNFKIFLKQFLTSTLIRAGRAAVEQNFRDTLEWDSDGFRDDQELDSIEVEIEEAAEEYSARIMDKLQEEGFDSAEDVKNKRTDLKEILSDFILEFEEEVKEGKA